ncbi:unnamed protein product [Paramecium primaurelia]|uniref:Phosphatidic acid phosphatase type 2/haloperoxidase domain-containing protein n=1 Tax=Paramecium primaurelia TaxID=5886 RepID=A0A8S1N0S6_PARPR|nr:unnamed protein product [Paramecium primaurelia]
MNKIILSILYTSLLIAYIVIDIAFNDELWDVSKSFALSMQKSIPVFEQLVYEFFSDIVFIPPIAAFYCFIYDDNKLNSLLYLSVVVTSVTTNEILKNIYHQARPYMIEPEIKSLKCNSDYGKPSGHSQNSLVMLILMPVLLFPSIKQLRRNKVQVEFQENLDKGESHSGYTIYSIKTSEIRNSQQQVNTNIQSKCKIAMKLMLIIFILLSIVMTGISRIFLGVHSLGQVILGWVWGIYITLMYIFVIHDPLKQYILKLLNPQRNRLEEINHFIPMSFFLLLILLGLSLGLLKLNSLVYYDKQDMSKWIARINECQSTHYTKDSPQILFNSCFQLTAIGAVITGLLVGAMLAQGSYEEGLFNKWRQKLPKMQHFKRLLLLLLPYLFLIPFLFIQSNSVVIQLICKILPLSFGAGFIINGVFPTLLRRFNLQIPGDFLFLCQRKYLLGDQSQNSLYQQIKEYNDQYQHTL